MTFPDRFGRRRGARLPLVTALSALAWLTAGDAAADPKLRYQIDQRGDMILIGNTFGFDCRSGIPKPVVGTVDTANCGTNIEDSSADVWWRDDEVGREAGRQRALSQLQYWAREGVVFTFALSASLAGCGEREPHARRSRERSDPRRLIPYAKRRPSMPNAAQRRQPPHPPPTGGARTRRGAVLRGAHGRPHGARP